MGRRTGRHENQALEKQAATWVTPEQGERVRDACLSEVFPNYRQRRNETVVVLLADTGLRGLVEPFYSYRSFRINTEHEFCKSGSQHSANM